MKTPVTLTLAGLVLTTSSAWLPAQAAAEPVQVEMQGRFGKFDRFDPLSVKSFTLKLNYNDRRFDPQLSSLSADRSVFVADAWSLQLAQVNGGTIPTLNPESTRSATGIITLENDGGDPDGFSDSSTLTVGLYNAKPALAEDIDSSDAYLVASFIQPDVFPGVDLPNLPARLAFAGGQIIYDSQRFSLSEVSLRTLSLASTGEPTRTPEAVPTPSAWAAGLLLLALGFLRRRPQAG